jgi:predicted ABC-type ATPase
MTNQSAPTCWIIAGPNGAGKTTFALWYLPQVANCRNFVNADAIAAGLSPLAPETALLNASRLFLKEIEKHIQNRQSFAFETTLSGRSYLKLIARLQADGWQVKLIYLALPNVTMSKMRVAERVVHGGHNIPQKDIERRFPRSLQNLLTEFSFVVDSARCYMNISATSELIFVQQKDNRTVINQTLFNQLIQQAGL